jgi:hypothetical protein
MSIVNPLMQALAREARVERGKAITAQGKLVRKMHRRRKGAAQPNVYQLFTSGKPTDEFREMMHVEASAENKKRRADYIAAVGAAIDAGGRYEGKLSEWRCYKHWSEKGHIERSEEDKKSRRSALTALNGRPSNQ